MKDTVKERQLYIPIEEELKKSYLTYAMSVIVSRALPDARDGLKPSQRRILVAMNDLHLSPNAKYRKCAKIAGDTSGNYHPHGEGVVYPTLVRMAQPFNLRYPLVDGQGNFGSLDGDPPAAMRYTEAKMTAVTMDMLEDLDKDTVDFIANYDETRNEPVVLPSRLPNLLINGSIGIAVGMSTSLPPHNLGEVCDAIMRVIEQPEITPEQLCHIIVGPDFPTGAIICGRSDVRRAYCSGRGTITVRAKSAVEERHGGKQSLVFSEIPYQLNKGRILENIADLVKDGKIKGVSDVRDESDREHSVRIVVDLKKGENEDVILNQLYKYTSLQTSFSIIMIALVNGRPQLLNIKDLITCFIEHRREVIIRRIQYLLDKAQKRAHIVDGLINAIGQIDTVIAIIRGASDSKEAKERLIEKCQLSALQTDAVLQMRLGTLTGLEHEKLREESKTLAEKIFEYQDILAHEQKIFAIIKEETIAIKNKYGDERRTQIGETIEDIDREDMIPDDQWMVLVTNKGYIKRMQIELYRKQQRGGSGVIGANMQEGDFVEQFFTASAHQYILFFSDAGKVYWLKVYEVPEALRTAKGRAIVNLLQLDDNETITSLIPITEFDAGRTLMMATEGGIVKKTVLSAFSRPKKLGIKAIDLNDNDRLIATRLTQPNQEVILATSSGKACHFNEGDVRAMGRAARGVRGCRLGTDDQVIGMVVVNPEETLLTITENGYGKRSPYDEYRLTRRGAQGVLNLKRTKKTGKVVSIVSVCEDDELMIITNQGMVIRINASLRLLSRATQGVKIIRLKEGDRVVSTAKLTQKILEKLALVEESEEQAQVEGPKSNDPGEASATQSDSDEASATQSDPDEESATQSDPDEESAT